MYTSVELKVQQSFRRGPVGTTAPISFPNNIRTSTLEQIQPWHDDDEFDGLVANFA